MNEEMKRLLEEIKVTWEQYKKADERRRTELEEHGKARAVTEQKLDRINERIDELETAIKRPAAGADEPRDDVGAEVRKTAFLEYLRKGKAYMEPDQRKALVEDANGQVLVPEDLEATIYQELPKITVIRQLASVRTTSRDRVRRRSLGKPAVAWGKLETGAQNLADSMPGSPAEEYLYIEDLYGLAKIGEDELMDTDVALADLVQSNFAEAIGEAEDTAFVVGSGHANGQPEGILNGTTAARVDGGAALTTDAMLDLYYAVPAQYAARAVYVVNRQTERDLRKLKDANDQYLWQPSVQAGAPATFNGILVYNQDDVPVAPSTSGNTNDVAICGSFRDGYQIRDRLGITVQRLNELYAEEGMVGIRVHYRVGGAVVRPEAFRVLSLTAA